MKRSSLRVRLLKILMIPIVIAFAITGIASYFNAYHEAEEVYDAQLAHFAKVLYALTTDKIDENDISTQRIIISEQLELHDYEKNFAYRVWFRDKKILHSSNSENFGPVSSTSGFTDTVIHNEHWRFFIYRNGKITIEVAERYEVRIDLIHHILEGIFLPQIFIIPLFALIVWFGVVKGIRPLEVLSALIRNRDPDNLEPIDSPVIPREVAPVVASVNNLMRRVTEVLEREKQFTNYAAHELRTPLAALKTQLQVALRADKQSREMYEELLPGIDRMQHLVEQLLSFVRVRSVGPLNEDVDMKLLCKQVLEEIAPGAANKNRMLESELAEKCVIRGNREMLCSLVRNLLTNAVKFTQENGHIKLSLDYDGGSVSLSVCDDGIGIAEKDHEKIFNSFYRVPGTDLDGCGLGLAIVSWVATMHNAKVDVTGGIEGKGSCFAVRFPAASAI